MNFFPYLLMGAFFTAGTYWFVENYFLNRRLTPLEAVLLIALSTPLALWVVRAIEYNALH